MKTPIRPYGDHLNDSLVQLGFTLPVDCRTDNGNGEKARHAALLLAGKMGLEHPEVAHMEAMLPGYTYFIVYGKCVHAIEDLDLLDYLDENAEEDRDLNKADVEALLESQLGRPLVIAGASTGDDTHTVGIDAILNLKGYDGQPGLEAYRGFQIHNFGGQVPNEQLVDQARLIGADAILVSQTVTQQNLHIHNLTQLVDLLEAEGLRDQIVLVCGGFQITDELAKELGYDRGFSRGSKPNQVANYLVKELISRQNSSALTVRPAIRNPHSEIRNDEAGGLP